MAVLGSILFNRTLKQFLNCKDLESDKGVGLTKKISQSATDSLDKILATIPKVDKPHSDILKNICLEHAEGINQEMLLNSLENDTTSIRSTAADILSQSTGLSPGKLFKRLQETDVSKTEIIDILDFQKRFLKPEQIINNALKLDKSFAERLFAMAADSAHAVDLDSLNIDPATIESPTIKILLLRYLAKLEQPEASRTIGKFLTDKNKTVVIEALKSLKAMTVRFDASVVLPFIETMGEIELEMAMDIIVKQADAELVPNLVAWTTGKSDDLREIFINLVIKHATEESLEKFLQRLEQQEWWGRDQAVKCLLRLADNKLAKVAESLADHQHEFVRSTAQQLSAQQSDLGDLDSLRDSALHENWQIREKAIIALGNSGKRESLGIFKKVIQHWPESAATVLKALARLGFSKGLEMAFACLKMSEAAIQRQALITIASLTTKQHAENVRENVMKMVPKLQATVRDTAEQVVTQLTSDFGLQELRINREDFFQTSLIKNDETPKQSIADSQPQVATQVVSFQNIEELKENDIWMDRYRINREIGRGAMGRVMLAEDEMVGEQLILKFMHPELTADGASRERFLREVKYSRKISHANVIRIHDLLFKDNLCAISMEFFLSRGIDEILREKKSFDTKEGLDILFQVAEGMAAAHKQEVIHRDLKPSNILMDDSGLVKVVDFGIATASSYSDATLTKTGSIIGTPAYLSPERAKGQEADYRCDIYAMGIIAYCMFVGHLPYKGEPIAILFQHLEGTAIPAHEAKPSVPVKLSQLIQKMMAVEAKNRIQTMTDVCIAINETREKLKLKN